MKKHKQKIQKRLFILLLIFLVSLISFLILIIFHQSATTSIVPKSRLLLMQEYKSNFLKISFYYPDNYKLEAGNNLIILKKGNEHIDIVRIGTNYRSIPDYLNDLERMNKVQIVERSTINIKDQIGMKAVIKHPISGAPDSYSYFFYPREWTVYSISTDSKELKEDLDKIAQSFQYTP